MAQHRESLEAAAQATFNTILLVEDDPFIRSVLVEAIALETPYRAVVASDGNSALHLVQHTSPCLFVLDYGLPGMNGIELYDRLHANPELARIPTILITANRTISQQQIRQRQLIAFFKPFDLEAFLAAIEALLTAPGKKAGKSLAWAHGMHALLTERMSGSLMTIQLQLEGNTADQALTRTDVVRLLEEVGSPDQLDVSGQNLRGIDLLQFNLKRATMSHARIGESNLCGANLSMADLRGADLRGTYLCWASLGGRTPVNRPGTNFGAEEPSSENRPTGSLKSVFGLRQVNTRWDFRWASSAGVWWACWWELASGSSSLERRRDDQPVEYGDETMSRYR